MEIDVEPLYASPGTEFGGGASSCLLGLHSHTWCENHYPPDRSATREYCRTVLAGTTTRSECHLSGELQTREISAGISVLSLLVA